MRIFLSGASGFVGGHAARALAARGHELTCLVRPAALCGSTSQTTAVQRLLGLPGLRLVEGEWTVPSSWLGAVAGQEVVINTVGAIRERPGASFKVVHVDSALALFRAAARDGARKIVQISAMGADARATSRYHLSKRAADEALAALGLPYVVLRPSFVYGPGDRSMAFFARLAALPLTPVPGDGRYRVQPIAIDDFVRAIVLSVERDAIRSVVVDCGGPAPLTFDALLDALARKQGKGQGARKLHLPWPLVRLVAALTDALGGHGPISRDELRMLRRGNIADLRPFVQLFGFEPAALEESIGVWEYRGIGV